MLDEVHPEPSPAGRHELEVGDLPCHTRLHVPLNAVEMSMDSLTSLQSIESDVAVVVTAETKPVGYGRSSSRADYVILTVDGRISLPAPILVVRSRSELTLKL